MNFKRFFVFFFLLITSLASLFGNDFQNKVITDSIQYLKKIVAEAPEIIKDQIEDKVYLEENRVYSTEENRCFLLGNEQNFPIHPFLIFFDNYGPYLSFSRELVAEKLFKNVCYNCKHEWEGGFALRCPNYGSKNIGNKPNW